MKNIKLFIIPFVFVVSLVSCGKQRKPQYQFMPDMYVSVPYDANGATSAGGVAVNRKPVKGTVSRSGIITYDIPDSNEGYEKAKAELKNPFKLDENNLENGKEMYGIYCAVCHGDKGDGNGILSKRDKFNGIPNYKDRDITDGSIYHVLMYGRNLMGSHSGQLTYKERWQVVMYVQKLKSELK